VHRQYDPPEGFGDDDVIVDIGANVGLFSVRAATYAPRGTVLAFEPAPDNFARLKENIQLNGLANVIAIQAAIAGKTESRHMYLGTEDTVSHSLWKGWGGSEQEITVQCRTLEDVMQEYKLTHIDLLKVDCEGAEGEIILGLDDETLRRIRRIGMEVHEWPGSDNTRQLKSFLESKGFLVSTERGFDAVRATWPPPAHDEVPNASGRGAAAGRSSAAH
jgi:FkbM family methyltransferase